MLLIVGGCMFVGLATAAGCQLVASCDVVVASDKASFATPGYCAVDNHRLLLEVHCCR